MIIIFRHNSASQSSESWRAAWRLSAFENAELCVCVCAC